MRVGKIQMNKKQIWKIRKPSLVVTTYKTDVEMAQRLQRVLMCVPLGRTIFTDIYNCRAHKYEICAARIWYIDYQPYIFEKKVLYHKFSSYYIYICIQKSRNHIHQYINLCVIKPLTSINKASTINERYTLNHLSLLLVMVQEAWLTKYDIIRSGNVVHKAITAIDLAITYGQQRSRTISSSCYTHSDRNMVYLVFESNIARTNSLLTYWLYYWQLVN